MFRYDLLLRVCGQGSTSWMAFVLNMKELLRQMVHTTLLQNSTVPFLHSYFLNLNKIFLEYPIYLQYYEAHNNTIEQ